MTIRDRIKRLDDFTRQYLVTALWAETDNSIDANCPPPLDDKYDIYDFSHAAIDRAETDCKAFYDANQADITHPDSPSLSRAGHDFWLTRNGHGTGYWDGDYPEAIGERLTAAAKSFGALSVYPYRGRLFFWPEKSPAARHDAET